MFSFRKKQVIVPASNEEKTIEVVKLWYVEWMSYRDSDLSLKFPKIRKEVECFTDEQLAKEFVHSLKQAHSLLHNTSDIKISLSDRSD